MKKILKLVAVLLGIGILGGCMNKPSKERMNEELKKPEVVEVIEQALKNLDKNALTEDGIIKSYEIDYDKTYYNPMGGIEFYMIINGDNKLVIEPTLTRFNDKYGLGAGVLSEALSELLRRD